MFGEVYMDTDHLNKGTMLCCSLEQDGFFTHSGHCLDFFGLNDP